MLVFPSVVGIFDLAKTKSDISNQLCGLNEIFVLPITKLFAGAQTKSTNFKQRTLQTTRNDTYGRQKLMMLLTKEDDLACCMLHQPHIPINRQENKVYSMLNINTYFSHKAFTWFI